MSAVNGALATEVRRLLHFPFLTTSPPRDNVVVEAAAARMRRDA